MHHRSILTGTGVLAALSMACLDRATADVDTTNLAEAPISTHEAAPKASPRVADNDFSDFQNQIDEHFEGRGDRRMYLQVDKPLYQPSETIWLRTWDLRARDLAPIDSIVKLELVDPRGSVVLSKTLDSKGGAENDLILPADIAGGEYILRIQELEEVVTERPIIVQRFEAPRVKKTLEFLRKAYGPGETAAATLSIKRPTGDPLANQDVVGVVQLDGQEIERVSATTDAEGGVIVQFALPDRIQTGDGTLTVLVKDGGVTESISRRVPIVLDRMRLNFYPEGGDLVEGLSSRVYFSATNLLGKPADVEGIIRDGRGQTVATFRSIHDGMGRFSFTPEPGQTYAAEITSPSSVKGTYRLPDAQADGCVLRTYDDFDSVEDTVRVGVWCRDNRTVRVQAVMRDDVVDGAAVQAGPERPGVVYLQTDPDAQGVARVTVFDDQMSPLAERLVFRNRTQQLQVTVEADKETYTPREQVSLTVTAKDARGEPVEAELALAVVDDTVLSFADDKQGHLLSRLFLESELHESVEEPNHYFDVTEANAGAALDSLLGTRGWRRFEWKPLLEAPPEPAYVRAARQWEQQKQLHNLGYLGYLDGAEMEDDRQIVLQAAAPMRPRRRLLAGVAKPAPPMDAPMAAPMAEPAKKAEEAPAVPEMDIAGEIAPNQQGLIARDLMFGMRADRDQEWDGGLGGLPANAAQLSPVRVFPAPKYDPDYEGPRSDFRQTIHWAPRVKTDASGQAKVSFHTSDAITSFRVTAEGVGGNLAGRAEEVFESSLPFSMNVKLPVAVTEGDQILLPLTLSNERERGTTVNVSAQFGDLFSLNEVPPSQVKLDGEARNSAYYPVDVVGKMGEASVSFEASAGGLSDAFERTVEVAPKGFPQVWEASGELADTVSYTIDLGEAISGTIDASVRLYPSPVATLTQGMEGMLREPGGCFEQTSSSNYPNVMVLRYLQEHEVADANLLTTASGMIDRGYQRLVGFESPEKGYEWFGGDPGHEALTAYGLVEFKDMTEVYGGVDREMLDRTAAWLKSRRDGDGGFLRDSKALDSFGQVSPAITDAYITWSLTEAGYTRDFQKEIARSARLAQDTRDPYLLALAANTLLNDPERVGEGREAVRRLMKMQHDDGAWHGETHSITRSTGANLNIEATALASMALMKADRGEGDVREAIGWLNNNRGGFGQWGATQATVLALRAMTDYASQSRKTRSSGTIEVLLNGEVVDTFDYAEGHRGAIVFEGLGERFRPGQNTLTLRHSGDSPLPLSAAVEYRSVRPATSPDATVSVETRLAKNEVNMGETVRLTATLTNVTEEGQPMTLARVGLPGGLRFQTWQLKELRDKGLIDFYETGAREVVLYLRDMAPSETVTVPLELIAEVPGRYTGPASSAYLYYTNEHKAWTDGVFVSVMP